VSGGGWLLLGLAAHGAHQLAVRHHRPWWARA
jgi:hypothetical protein